MSSKRLSIFGIVLLAVGMRLFALSGGSGSISLTTAGGKYSQDFNSLASTGAASDLLPTGWLIDESGTSARNDGKYTPGTGSDNAGDIFAFGSPAGGVSFHRA